MATLRAIKRRIRSVRNIAQVTRAMEMVAAARMRRAEQQTLGSRAYAQKAWEVLTYLASQPERGGLLHPLLEVRPVQTIGVVLITTDRGLCGALNHNLLRQVSGFVKEQNRPVKFITVGRKGRDFMHRAGQEVVAEFTGLGDRPTVLDITPIAHVAIADFLAGEMDEVYVAYNDFVTVLTQRPTIQQLLPIQPAVTEARMAAVYIYEPDPETILSTVLPRFTELQIYQALLEGIASEHAARMVAMRNATDSANDLIGELTLTYNKARQTAITKEMMDIAGGAEALKRARAAS